MVEEGWGAHRGGDELWQDLDGGGCSGVDGGGAPEGLRRRRRLQSMRARTAGALVASGADVAWPEASSGWPKLAELGCSGEVQQGGLGAAGRRGEVGNGVRRCGGVFRGGEGAWGGKGQGDPSGSRHGSSSCNERKGPAGREGRRLRGEKIGHGAQRQREERRGEVDRPPDPEGSRSRALRDLAQSLKCRPWRFPF